MKEILRSFFFSDAGKTNFKVPYFWSTIIITLFVITAIISLLHPEKNYTGLLATLAGMVTGLIAVYNQGKNGHEKNLSLNELIKKHGKKTGGK